MRCNRCWKPSWANKQESRGILVLCDLAASSVSFSSRSGPFGALSAAERVDLALHKPAKASIENDEHNAAAANDGNPDTYWCADDEPENGEEWWQVDLEKPTDLSGCQIRWLCDDKKYLYKIEGSADGKTWSMLSDQTHTTARKQVQNPKFASAKQIRYVRITVTDLDEACWVSISEAKCLAPLEIMLSRWSPYRVLHCHAMRMNKTNIG